MKKTVVSILGEDKPGIVHGISKTFFDSGCNILELSQTILQTEFAGIFIIAMPDDLDEGELARRLEEMLSPMNCKAYIKEFHPPAETAVVESEPFVVTLRGEDRLGIVPEFSSVIAGFEVNIENLRAISQKEEQDGVIIIFEVAVPLSVHRPAFREALRWKAEELGLQMSVQHRDIFEAIHRI